MMVKLFPILLISINISAGIVCFSQGDIKRGLYWLFAAGLNICVTL